MCEVKLKHEIGAESFKIRSISSQDLSSSSGGTDKRSVLLRQIDYMTGSLKPGDNLGQRN